MRKNYSWSSLFPVALLILTAIFCFLPRNQKQVILPEIEKDPLFPKIENLFGEDVEVVSFYKLTKKVKTKVLGAEVGYYIVVVWKNKYGANCRSGLIRDNSRLKIVF